MSNKAHFYAALWGVSSEEQSARLLAEHVLGAPVAHTVVVLAHNGPTGLGGSPADICGKDWGRPSGGDWGDADLEMGLAACPCVDVPLVVFGHMHHRTRGGGERKLVERRCAAFSYYDLHLLGVHITHVGCPSLRSRFFV